MTYSWSIIDSGKNTAEKNMSLDSELLAAFNPDSQQPILHLYDWEGPSATYGHFIKPEDLIRMDDAKLLGLQLARRPTGGGMIFHVTDWAFSILVPAGHPAYSVNTLENYAFVNKLVIDVLSHFSGNSSNMTPFISAKSGFNLLAEESSIEFSSDGGRAKHFCMAKPTRYDVMLNGRKVSGGAQRKTRFGFLHQGTVSLALPSNEFLKRILIREPAFLNVTDVQALMKMHTAQLLSEDATFQDVVDARACLNHLFKKHLRNL